ncbi:MAG: 16S rRNA (cytosine(1402)-N(4))-methyltransferase RsmH [Sphingomonadales bacterium]|jgi:16S rRNA (cytosine1402-N4)-methyltransferase|nr:16S rRNA (cytosine(1402)-N(4))-methyltransferase RsmH [Sphingomonadales bacterium]MBK9004056.1 16S rRNA (cytosine(1402)-N(4))-methyltransferase RsmH [Sphingomonadales bacterium]MBK9269231.1 16S rRNA (cytosine(1402)-N(4))-methyltransferase RsmH [Sphingomonadales bacterium]MBP6433753.1 16S rRNA (cytosine(1402)-N(4))-methyltransferase RsmH [Sphingorhabdus sp.]
MTQPSPHIPVLLDEVIHALAITPGSDVVDGTFGAGGYSRAILAAGARVHAFDRDPDAAAAGADLAERSGGVLHFHSACFSEMDKRLAEHGVQQVDAVVLDIGVSSMQIDQAERGFSFQKDGPLDMRMSQSGESAADFVNNADESEIANVIYLYGEEPKSRRIARAIVAARPIDTTTKLADVVRKALGHRAGAPKDPATRTFQALRIHVNRELDELNAGLEAAERILKPGGRLAVVSFHSLEDRIVKQFLRERSGSTAAGSRHMPVVKASRIATFEKPSKAVRPCAREIEANPRARSSTLRSAVRTDAPAWSQQELAA